MGKNRLIEDVSKIDGILFFSITLGMASMKAWYTANGVLTSIGRDELMNLPPDTVFKNKHELAIVNPLESEFDNEGRLDYSKLLLRALEYDLQPTKLHSFPALLSFVSSQICRLKGEYECVCLIEDKVPIKQECFSAVRTYEGRYVLETRSISNHLMDVSPSPAFLFERKKWQ